MKKILIYGLVSSVLATGLYAEDKIKLKDSMSFGFFGGTSSQNASLGSETSSISATNIEARFGFEKTETHRFSVLLNKQTNVNLKVGVGSYDYTATTIGMNYDFQIKNLDTKTSLFFGPSISITLGSISGNNVNEDSIDVSLGGRVGISQSVGDNMDLELYHQLDFSNMDIEGIKLGNNSKTMLGLLFKF